MPWLETVLRITSLLAGRRPRACREPVRLVPRPGTSAASAAPSASMSAGSSSSAETTWQLMKVDQQALGAAAARG